MPLLDPLNYILFASQADADGYLAALNASLGYPKPDFIAHGRTYHGDVSYSDVEAKQEAPFDAWRVNIPDDNGGIFDAGPPVTISSSGDGWIDPATFNGTPVIMAPDTDGWVLPVPAVAADRDI